MNMISDGIPTGNPPLELQELEREKSRLLFEAHLHKAQHRYAEAADRFTRVAEIERLWVEWAESERLEKLAILHRRSELSCWAQAGYPHRALQLANELLGLKQLDMEQREDLVQQRNSLQQQFVSWMGEWASVPAAAD